MKRIFLLTVIYLFSLSAIHAQEESPYFLVSKSDESVADRVAKIKSALSESGFKIIGEYHPAQSENLAVVCYTHPQLEEIALSFSDRGALASTLKVGLKKDDEMLKTSVKSSIIIRV